MTRILILAAAICGMTFANAQSARLGSLGRNDMVVTNVPAAIGGMTTNDVQAIVTNEVPVEFAEWAVTNLDSTSMMVELRWSGGSWTPYEVFSDEYAEPIGSGIGNGQSTELRWVAWEDGPFNIYARRYPVKNSNALGLARLVDLPPLTNGLATAASVSAANTRAASAQTTANNVASTVAAWETYWDGDEVRVTVTNYYGSQDIPSLYIEEKNENTNTYKVVWDERTRWRTNAVQMAELRAAIEEKADRAWGFYDSHTGNYAPDGYTWLSSPKIAIAGGLAYQRTLTTSGAIWVLASNGMVAQTDGTENGFFRIKDDEGNVTFEIVRGNKRTVGATAAGIKVESSGSSHTITIPYNVVSEASPTLYGTTDLASGEWTQLAPIWTGQSGAWTGTVTTASSQYFVKGEYETGGETYIKNVAPISAESGIYCTDGIHKVRPVYTNGTITWEVVQ